MRRRARIDLGQELSDKEEAALDRKRQRWANRNKDRPDHENPFLRAIRPDHENYGDLGESGEELRARLNNLEFGNFPGYFKYRKNAAPDGKDSDDKHKNNSYNKTTECQQAKEVISSSRIDRDGGAASTQNQQPLETGLSDERLSLMKSEWFEGKEVLDIGCNRGHITYAIARLFNPKFILGIDIDLKMIQMANRDLHLHVEEGLVIKNNELRCKRAMEQLKEDQDSSSLYHEQRNHFPLSCYISHGPLAVDYCGTSSTNNDTNSSGTNLKMVNDDDSHHQFPNNILFIEHNYVLAKDELVDKQKEYFDTIVCLSVTKWVHLNYCDNGLKRFFRRIYKHLKPGGLFVLESQPFDNYGRRKKLSDRLRANYYSIKFKPDQFDDYLLSSEVGFTSILQATTTEHECAGFKRPLKVFIK